MLHSETGADCQKCEPLFSLLILEHDKLRSEGCVQEESCRDGDTEPDDRLDGEGGVGDVVPCCCQGTVPGGDRVTGTTFFTAMKSVSQATTQQFVQWGQITHP